MCCFILLLFFTSVCGQVPARAPPSSYFNDEFGTASFNVPFGPGHLNVWQHTTTRGRYYVSPITALLSDTADCRNNPITGKIELRFDVILWSLEAREVVHRYIRANENPDVSIDDIEPIPMERIRLVWRDTDRPLRDAYRLSQSWKTNTRLPSQVTFLILCETMDDCEQLKQILRDEPELVDGFDIQYVVEAQRSARKTVNVQGKHVWQGRLFTQLRNQLPTSGPVYLNSGDLKTIVSETVSSVVATVVTDADHQTEDDFSVTDAVNTMLTRNRVSTQQFTPHMWNSTFWEPSMTRPDKVTQTLNRMFTRDANDSSSLRLNERNNTGRESTNVDVDVSVWGLVDTDFKYSDQSESTSSSRIRAEDMNKMLRERDIQSEWTGERFEIKPMELYRLNVGALNTTTTIARGSVQIRRYETVRHIRVNVGPVHNQTTTLTPQLVEKRLNQRLENLNQTIIERLNIHDERMRGHDERMRGHDERMRGEFNHYMGALNQSIGEIDRKMSMSSFSYCSTDGRVCVRLVNGRHTSSVYSGRVELSYNGRIGTICDNDWDNNDAKVICRMLGYRGRAVAISDAYYGPGTGQIWLHYVDCTGDEESISDCIHSVWGLHLFCGHHKDAGVDCHR